MTSMMRMLGLLAGLLVWSQVLAQDLPKSADQPANTTDQLTLSPLESAVRQALQADLENLPVPVGGNREAIRKELLEFYAQREYRPAWLDGRGARSQLGELIGLLKSASDHGLIPAEYRAGHLDALLPTIPGLIQRRQIAYLAGIEALASSAALSYASDLANGRFTPEQLDRHAEVTVDLEPREVDAAMVLAKALEQGIERTFQGLAPQHPQYQRLQQLLADLRQQPEFPKVELDGLLRDGDRHPALLTVREILNHKCHQCRPLPTSGDSVDQMNDRLVEAIKTFQSESAIREDGIIGPNTVDMLNLGVETQIEWVRTNLDRWRWYNGRLEPPYILVNVPEYRLRYYASPHQPPLEMNIIVGKVANATPMFSDVMEHAVIRPYWHVPRSIATEEMLPKIKKDVAYFWEEGIEVLHHDQPVHPLTVDWQRVTPENFDFTFRQLPGPQNSLGLIKFMFPNKHAIYLHDTPADQLFEHQRRAFSHGCIRLERPFELARALLPPNVSVDRRSIGQAREDAQEIGLQNEIPVHIAYFTVVVDDQGRPRFFDDIYRIDEASQAALAEAGRAVERANRTPIPAS